MSDFLQVDKPDELDIILLTLCHSASQQNGSGSPTYGKDYQSAKQAIHAWKDEQIKELRRKDTEADIWYQGV